MNWFISTVNYFRDWKTSSVSFIHFGKCWLKIRGYISMLHSFESNHWANSTVYVVHARRPNWLHFVKVEQPTNYQLPVDGKAQDFMYLMQSQKLNKSFFIFSTNYLIYCQTETNRWGQMMWVYSLWFHVNVGVSNAIIGW